VSRRRLDAELVRRGLVATRTEAAAAIERHAVLVNGAVAEKPARLVDPADALVVQGDAPQFVSRGGDKLDHALDAFGIDVTGLRVLDAGASTGGFSDCLLQRGAAHVVALDVGHGQLHPKIRGDERVTVLERCNVREATVATIGGAVDLVVADLSFISLTKVIPALVAMTRPGGALVLLVKPQFEAGRVEVSKGRGVITDPVVQAKARGDVEESLVAAGTVVAGWTESPITGADGNREFLVHAIGEGSGGHR
jgi:23S rRNA (cytidine1920-2'-O)/16S rRNA (cytidine1409-2'-O)-methyltransferase